MENLYDSVISFAEFQQRCQDNIFRANHRNEMIRKYGFTNAELIQVDDLVGDKIKVYVNK